ncbi:MAG: peptidylprolyl isomerase [Roseiflexaceae bacterium]
MTQPPHDAREQARRVAVNRQTTRRDREDRRRRTVMWTTLSAIGIAVVSLAIGALYDLVYVPNQQIASVGDASLNRNQYVQEKRLALTSGMAQNVLLATFGGTFGTNYAQQNPFIEDEISKITINAPVDDMVVQDWVNRQLLRIGAQTEFNVVPDKGRMDQLLIADFSFAFPVIDPTAPTAVPEPTAVTPADENAEPTAVPPTATPDAAKAQSLAPNIVDQLFASYQTSLTQQGVTPKLTRDDFVAALDLQYARTMLIEKVKENLLPADAFTASTAPRGYETSHILVRVDVPEGATDAERQQLFDTAKPRAESIIKKLDGGADFVETLQTDSDDFTSKSRDGAMDKFDATGKSIAGTQYDANYVAATLMLDEGDYTSEPIRTAFGWHVIRLDRIEVPSFEDQLDEARTAAYEEWFNGLDEKYSVTYAVDPTATLEAQPTDQAPVLPTAPLAGYPTDTPTAIPTVTLTVTPTANP